MGGRIRSTPCKGWALQIFDRVAPAPDTGAGLAVSNDIIQRVDLMGPAFDRFNAAALRPEKAVPAGVPQCKIRVLLHVADVPANVSRNELRQDVSMPVGHADGDDRHTKSRQTFVKRQHDNSPLCRGQQDGRSFTQFAAAYVTPTVILFRGLFVIAVDVLAMMPDPKPSRVAGEPRIRRSSP